MKSTRTPIACSMLLIGGCIACFTFAVPAETKDSSSLFALTDPVGLSALETRNASVSYIDTRENENCLEASIKGGLCISPTQLRYPEGALASFRDINWLVGTYGMSTESVAVVVGDDRKDKYMVAAVLYLLGIREVAVWESDFASIAAVRKTGKGRGRGLLRSEYFSNPMRDEHIVLDGDLQLFFKTAATASIEKLTSTGFIGHLVRASSQLPIVTGATPSAALVNFTDQVLNQKKGGLRVHTNGLNGRPFSDFGYIQAKNYFAFVIAAMSVLLVGVIVARRKLS